MPNFIISSNPEQEFHPGISVDGVSKAQKFKYVVTDASGTKIRYRTDYEYELLVSTEKTREMGLNPIVVTVPHFQKCKKRDGMVPIRELKIAHLRPAGWKPKSQVVVSLPDVYVQEDVDKQIEAKTQQIEDNGTKSPGRPKKT